MTATGVPASIAEPFRRAIQIGVVVRDLDQSMAALTAIFGMGPFRVVDCPLPEREQQQFYYGQPTRFRMRQAFADLGSVELELIQPLEGQTIWSEFLAERGPGIHHIRFNVPDEKALSAYLQEKGIGKTQEGAGIREGSYWANYDTEKLVGFVIEILQPALGSDGRTPGVVKQEMKES
jgi:methylmalonyl-CoA/ethylmalonyl-CoA epimerase